MGNFVKAFCVCVIGFVILQQGFVLLNAILDVFLLGKDESLNDLEAFLSQYYWLYVLFILIINGGILIFIGLPFYGLVVKFLNFNMFSCIILGLIIGAANQFIYSKLSYGDYYDDRLIYFLIWGAIFGFMLNIAFRLFNKPLTVKQMVD